MFIDQLLGRLATLIPLLQPVRNQEKSERFTIDAIDMMIAEKKYKQALRVINRSLKNGTSSNQLLLKKAFLLSQSRHYDEAHAIWKVLSKNKNKPKLALSAKTALKISQQNRDKDIKSIKKLFQEFHAISNQYEWNAKYIPKPNDWDPKASISDLICNESKSLNSNDFPALAHFLTSQALEILPKSPRLAHNHALSLAMMGKPEEAYILLEEFSQEVTSPKTLKTISATIKILKNNTKNYKQMRWVYLIKQFKIIARANKPKGSLHAKPHHIKNNTDAKELTLTEAELFLKYNPQICLNLVSSILDYFPKNQRALLLKSEALASLGQNETALSILEELASSERSKLANKASDLIIKSLFALKQNDNALQIWDRYLCSKDKNISTKAARLITDKLADLAVIASTKKSPKSAIFLYIKEHLDRGLVPASTKKLDPILIKIEPLQINSQDPLLEQKHLQIAFNSQLIEYLDDRLKKAIRQKSPAPVQKPAAIRKTAPKAG